jgi:hypothetical protein
MQSCLRAFFGRFSLWVGIVLVLHAGAWSHAGSAKDRFSEEYRAAAERLERFYDRVQILEKQSGEGVRREHNKETCTVRYMSNGPLKRTDLLDESGQTLTGGVATPSRTFRAQRTDASSKFVLNELNRDNYSTYLERMRTGRSKLAFAPYCILDARLVDFLFDSKCKVIAVDEIDEGGEERVRVSFEKQFPEDGLTTSGWVALLPGRSWAISEYKYGRLRCKIEYGDDVGGMPMIHRAEHSREDFTGPWWDVEALEFKAEPASEQEFTLSAFGIPESVAGPAAETVPRGWILLLLNALILAAIVAIYLARRGKRQA